MDLLPLDVWPAQISQADVPANNNALRVQVLTGNVIGNTITADPEEEQRQKTFKGILNKLTIDNFEKLSAKVAVQHGRGGRGKLVISYHGLDTLDGILERLRGN